MIKTHFQKEENILNVILSNNSVNSISLSMLKELHKVLDNHNLDKKRCIVFSSNQKHFCVGADLKEKSGFSYNQTLDFLDSLNELYHKIEILPIPTIAVVTGGCLGGGLEFALSCDFRIGLDDSFYSFPETSIGIIPGAGGTQRMTRLTNPSTSMKWIFSANKYTATEALDDGVIDFVVNKDSLEGFLDNFVRNITKNAPIAIKAAKKSINATFINLGFKTEREQYIKTLNSKDRNEGLSSFKNKTTPNWKNK